MEGGMERRRIQVKYFMTLLYSQIEILIFVLLWQWSGGGWCKCDCMNKEL